MHIILTANYSPWSAYSGGGQSSTHNIATALSNIGHEVDVIFTKTPFETIKIPTRLNYTLHWALIPSPRSRRASWLRNFSIFSVRNKVNKLLSNETIVHCNGEEGALIHSLKGKRKIILVCTPRYPHIPKAIKEPLPSLINSFLGFRNTKYYLLGKMIEQADLCCPTSNYALKILKSHYSFKRIKKVKIIPNGVNEIFLQAKMKNKFDSSLIYFGRLASSKGANLLLEAISLINNKDLSLTIIGRGDLLQKLKAQSKKLGLTNKVIFKTWMSPQSLAFCLENTSYAVLPSNEESFGNTMAESMATGTPVISTTAGSISEVVLHGKTGLLVEPGNTKALADAIKKLIDDSSLSQNLAKNARERIKQNFTWPVVAHQLELEYKKLLNAK